MSGPDVGYAAPRRHTLLKRLPDTATRVLRDNEATLPQDAKDSLLSLSEEVPNVPLRTPDAVEGGATTDIKHFNQEWDRWTRERASGNWTIASHPPCRHAHSLRKARC
eukprot:2370751-Rhodomonas_salina.2